MPGLNVVRQGRSMTSFFHKEPDHAVPPSRHARQPAAPAVDRRHEHATFLTRNAAQLSARHRSPGNLPRAFTRHGDRRRPAPVPNRAAGGWRSRSDDEQHRVGATVLLHPDPRPPGPGAQARPPGASSEPACGAEPRRGCPVNSMPPPASSTTQHCRSPMAPAYVLRRSPC